MTLQWIASDLRTGNVLADLPTLEVDYPIRRTIGQYDTATARLHLDGAPPNWRRAVLEGGAVLHCYDDADKSLTLQWSGIVTMLTIDSADDVAEVTLATGEAYFDRRYVGDVTYTGTGQNVIVADLVERYAGPASLLPGIPVTTRVVTAGDGAARDRAYKDDDDATLYARLQQLAAVDGGPEWCVTWEWSDDGTRIVPVVLVGDRIGRAAPAGLAPAVSFDLPGPVLSARWVGDYSAGKGANIVVAVSSGQGETRPSSGPVLLDDGTRPAFEYRWTPSTSITNTATLQAYARQALALLRAGSRALTLTAAREAAPALGDAWQLGDDVGYDVADVDDEGRPIPGFAGGVYGVGRAIAYELTESTVAPILAIAEFVE